MVSAVRFHGPCAPLVFDGAMNSDIFLDWTRQFLLRELQEGDVVILDNLRPHWASGFQALVESVGARVLHLPPYSPDFNPIENMWAKIKAFLRKAKARTFDALVNAVGGALMEITPEDCLGFFRHCGYVSTAT